MSNPLESQIDKLIAEHEEAIDLLKQLKNSATHQRQREANEKPTVLHLSDQDMLELRRQYLVAREMEDETFTFQGHVLVTDYAKYVLEHFGVVL